jgi:hypothetical protein
VIHFINFNHIEWDSHECGNVFLKDANYPKKFNVKLL